MRQSAELLKKDLKLKIVHDHLEFVAYVDNGRYQKDVHASPPEIYFTTLIFSILHHAETAPEAAHAMLHLFNSLFHELEHLWFRACDHNLAAYLKNEHGAKAAQDVNKATPEEIKFVKSRRSDDAAGEGREIWEEAVYGGLVSIFPDSSNGQCRLQVLEKDGSTALLRDEDVVETLQNLLQGLVDDQSLFIWPAGTLFNPRQRVQFLTDDYNQTLISARHETIPADLFPSHLFPPYAHPLPKEPLGTIGRLRDTGFQLIDNLSAIFVNQPSPLKHNLVGYAAFRSLTENFSLFSSMPKSLSSKSLLSQRNRDEPVMLGYAP
ncbi:hypothetical protein C8J56DRAFT_911985, partial [Mycena floridula]